MKKVIQGSLVAALVLCVSASVAFAGNPSVNVGLSSSTVEVFHFLGVGAAVNVPFGTNGWSVNVDGRYDMGNFKSEDSSVSPTDVLEEKLSGFRVRGGIDHTVMVGGMRIYGGTGVSYSSHKIKTTQTGFNEVESEPYNVFGINSRIGGAVPLGADNPISMFVQAENTLGWGSIDQNNVKVTQTDVQNGFQIGFRYDVPGQN